MSELKLLGSQMPRFEKILPAFRVLFLGVY